MANLQFLVWSGHSHVWSTRQMVTELLNMRNGQSPVSVCQWVSQTVTMISARDASASEKWNQSRAWFHHRYPIVSLPPGTRNTSACSPHCPTNSSSWASPGPRCMKPWDAKFKSRKILVSDLLLTSRGGRRRHRANCSWKRMDDYGSMYCGYAGNISSNRGHAEHSVCIYHIYRLANQYHLLVWRQILDVHPSHRRTFGSSACV